MSDPATFRSYNLEIMGIILDYAAAASGLEGPELIALRKQENAALFDKLNQQKRAIAFIAGEPVAPEVHYAAAVLYPKGGLG